VTVGDECNPDTSPKRLVVQPSGRLRHPVDHSLQRQFDGDGVACRHQRLVAQGLVANQVSQTVGDVGHHDLRALIGLGLGPGPRFSFETEWNVVIGQGGVRVGQHHGHQVVLIMGGQDYRLEGRSEDVKAEQPDIPGQSPIPIWSAGKGLVVVHECQVHDAQPGRQCCLLDFTRAVLRHIVEQATSEQQGDSTGGYWPIRPVGAALHNAAETLAVGNSVGSMVTAAATDHGNQMAKPDDTEAPVFVAGHKGLVGSALVRRLREAGYQNLLTVDRQEVDLRSRPEVEAWFDKHRPQLVYLAAGTVGGVLANSTRQAEFLYDNMLIHATVVEASRQVEVRKLLYLGSSCIYPRATVQPIPESALMTGALEPTNEGYALAKIAGIKLCQFYREQYGCNFISVMPTNLYGQGDNFDLNSSHVIPALIRKFHDAKLKGRNEVEVWGTGTPRREFLHVDDLADACLFLMDNYESATHINVGTGIDQTIAELATLVRDVVHPRADLQFDPSKPDGIPRKVLDVSRLHDLGWKHSVELRDGIVGTYAWFQQNYGTARGVGSR